MVLISVMVLWKLVYGVCLTVGMLVLGHGVYGLDSRNGLCKVNHFGPCVLLVFQ